MTKLLVTVLWLGIVAIAAHALAERIADAMDNAANQIVAARVNN